MSSADGGEPAGVRAEETEDPARVHGGGVVRADVGKSRHRQLLESSALRV